MHILILAGGEGTRLWPLSTYEVPKQFIHFGDELSLLQKTVKRFLYDPITSSITILTNRRYHTLTTLQMTSLHALDRISIIHEPTSKNTCPAIAYGVKYLEEKCGLSIDERVLVIPSDHLIEPQAVFSHFLSQIQPLLKEQLVLFGIRPTKPETGYGYIQIGKTVAPSVNLVKRFVEKPNLELAERYLNSGDYYWNAGMFAFSISFFWKSLAECCSNIYQQMSGSLDTLSFSEMPNISYDYAVLEKLQNALVCPLPVTWSDVGSWDSVYEIMDKDANQNAKLGNVCDIDTKNCLILGKKTLIATLGLEDLIIVESEGVLFIGKRGQSQKVRQLVEHLPCHAECTKTC